MHQFTDKVAELENTAALAEICDLPFPVEALPPVIRDIAVDLARVYKISPAMPAMAALAINGAAAGKRYRLAYAVNGQESYANLYITAVAPRGAGKSSVASVLADPVMQANQELERDFLPIKLKKEAEASILEEERKAVLRRASQKPENKETALDKLTEIKMRQDQLFPGGRELIAPSFLEGNCTSEALARSLMASSDQAILSHSAEAGELIRVALGKYNRDQKGDFDLLLSGWSSEPVTFNRINRGRIDLKPTISALWYVQPVIMDELVNNPEAFERGLTARMLIFNSGMELQYDEGEIRSIDSQSKEEWDAHIRHLLKLRKSDMSSRVECSPEAREVFRAFHNESIDLRRGKYADVEGELSRWRENAIRIALGLWIADNEWGCLTKEQAERAVQITRWCYQSYLMILNRGRIKRRLSRVEDLRKILLETEEKTATLRDLTNRHGFSKEEVKSLAVEFPDKLEIVERPPGAKGGRPSEVVRIPAPVLRSIPVPQVMQIR